MSESVGSVQELTRSLAVVWACPAIGRSSEHSIDQGQGIRPYPLHQLRPDQSGETSPWRRTELRCLHHQCCLTIQALLEGLLC
jgi:hypothetical protein